MNNNKSSLSIKQKGRPSQDIKKLNKLGTLTYCQAQREREVRTKEIKQARDTHSLSNVEQGTHEDTKKKIKQIRGTHFLLNAREG